MIKTRRSLSSLVLLLLMAVIVAACSQQAAPEPASDSAQQEDTQTDDTSQQEDAQTDDTSQQEDAESTGAEQAGDEVVLQYWEMDWGPKVTAILEELVAEYSEKNPNVEVEMTMLTWGDYVQKMLSAVAAGSPPDITGGDAGLPFNFYAQGEALPLNDLYEKWKSEGRFDDLTKWGQEKWFYDDNYVGVTWQIDPRAIYYRTDLLEEAGIAPPTTHDELLAAAVQLTDRDAEKYGICFPGKSGTYDPDQFYMTLVLQNGGALADAEGNPTFETPEHVTALKFAKELMDKAASEGTPSHTFAEVSRLYQQGQCAMAFNGGWFIQQLKEEAPEIYEVTDILAPLKGQGPNAVQRMVGFYNPWMIFRQTKHPEEAKAFLEFMTAPETVKRIYAADVGSKFSPYTSIRDDEFWGENPLADKLNQQVSEYAVDYWYPNNSAAIGIGSMGTGIADFIVNPVLVGARSPEEALADGQEKLGKLFRKMGE